MTENADSLEAQLSSAEEMHGTANPFILPAINDAAEFHLFRGNYQRAEELLKRAAEIAAKQEPSANEQSKLAKQKLAWLYFMQARFEESGAYFLQALDVSMADPNAGEDSKAQAIRCMIYFFLRSGQLQEAENALHNLLSLFQQNKQESHYQAAFVLVSLAVVADARQAPEASRGYAEKAALIIKDKCAIGYTVDYLSLSEIINLYFSQDRKAEALELVACTMLESEDLYWTHNPVAGEVLSLLAEFMRGQRKFKQAESIYKRAIAIKELTTGPENPDLAGLSMNLGNMYLGLRKYADAEPLVKQAMKARVKYYGAEHPAVAACVETYATILRRTKRAALANKLDMRAREIRSACVAKLDRETKEKSS